MQNFHGTIEKMFNTKPLFTACFQSAVSSCNSRFVQLNNFGFTFHDNLGHLSIASGDAITILHAICF